MRPRLVATDLDGTLVRSDGTVSPRTTAAIARIEAAGVPFVMVTGRPPRWMEGIAEATGHRGLAVCANGALVYDLHAARVVRTDLLSGEAALGVVDALRRELPGITFAVERHELAGDVIKLLARHEKLTADELLASARGAVGDAATLTHSSAEGLLEISAAGVSKASGLASLAAEFGVEAADVIAFGDMPNDLPMLAWAGRAVAVANAHPEVLAAADEVTASNDDDGVAQVLDLDFP